MEQYFSILFLQFLLIPTIFIPCSYGQSVITTRTDDSLLSDVHIECNSNNIMVKINTSSFHGLIYPKGLSQNSSCMKEYISQENVTYVLPLRSCNTMSADVVSNHCFLLVLNQGFIVKIVSSRMIE